MGKEGGIESLKDRGRVSAAAKEDGEDGIRKNGMAEGWALIHGERSGKNVATGGSEGGLGKRLA